MRLSALCLLLVTCCLASTVAHVMTEDFVRKANLPSAARLKASLDQETMASETTKTLHHDKAVHQEKALHMNKQAEEARRAEKKELKHKERVDSKAMKNRSEEKQEVMKRQKREADKRAELKMIEELKRMDKKYQFKSDASMSTELKSMNKGKPQTQSVYAKKNTSKKNKQLIGVLEKNEKKWLQDTDRITGAGSLKADDSRKLFGASYKHKLSKTKTLKKRQALVNKENQNMKHMQATSSKSVKLKQLAEDALMLEKQSNDGKDQDVEKSMLKHAPVYMKMGRTLEERRALKALRRRMKRAAEHEKGKKEMKGKKSMLSSVTTKGLVKSRGGLKRYSEEDHDYMEDYLEDYVVRRRMVKDLPDNYYDDAEMPAPDPSENEVLLDFNEANTPQPNAYESVGYERESPPITSFPLPTDDPAENEIMPVTELHENTPAGTVTAASEHAASELTASELAASELAASELAAGLAASKPAASNVSNVTPSAASPHITSFATPSTHAASTSPSVPTYTTTVSPTAETTARSGPWPWEIEEAGAEQCGQARFGPESRVNRGRRMLKILQGKEALPGSFPWQVAILDKDRDLLCGGTLIAPRWVMTAAHCVRKKMFVRLSEHHIHEKDGHEIEQKVRRIFPHPDYNSSTIDNDFALLRLPAPPTYPHPVTGVASRGITDRACLPVDGEDFPPVGTRCLVMGWGKASQSHSYGTDVLMYTRLPIISRKSCIRTNRKTITENMFCAGHYKGGADTCSGDSGGPLLCSAGSSLGQEKWVVYGVTSFGDGCGNAGKIGVYAKVNVYLDWMADIMRRY